MKIIYSLYKGLYKNKFSLISSNLIRCLQSLTNSEFNRLSNEFYKMLHRECKVVTDLFPSSTYTLDISLAYQNVRSRKVTIKFTECI